MSAELPSPEGEIKDGQSAAHNDRAPVRKDGAAVPNNGAPVRNDGVDACRIAAMFLIVLLHVLNFGGLLYNAPLFSGQYCALWLLETIAFCAANTYALISGYVGYGSRFRYANILYLCTQVLFYTLLITALYALFRPVVVGRRVLLEALFPWAYPNVYWYFTAYFCLFFFLPLLNLILDNLDRFPGGAAGLAVSAFALFSLVPTLFNTDPGGGLDGYSPLWLAILYLAGGCLKKYSVPERLPAWANIAFFCLGVAVNMGVKLAGEWMQVRLGTYQEPGFWLLRYPSPTILLCAVCLLNFFSRLRVGGMGRRFVRCFAPVTFGVYLIHCEPLLRSRGLLWGERALNYQSLSGLLSLPPVLVVPAVLGVTAGIWLICSLLDRVRLALFRRLGVRERCVRLEAYVRSQLSAGRRDRA